MKIYRTTLLDNDRNGNYYKFEQYFMLNARYQIQLIYPFYEDYSEKFRITDWIKEKYKINYILEDEKYIQVHHTSFLDRGILEFKPDSNVTREKHMILQQLNQNNKKEGFRFDQNVVIQLVCDGIKQQVVYIQSYKEKQVQLVYLKDVFTEENFERKFDEHAKHVQNFSVFV